MTCVKIFLSTVSSEFRSYRESLRHGLDQPNLTVKVQEDFIATGTETLIKLDDYIRECDAVVHLVSVIGMKRTAKRHQDLTLSVSVQV